MSGSFGLLCERHYGRAPASQGGPGSAHPGRQPAVGLVDGQPGHARWPLRIVPGRPPRCQRLAVPRLLDSHFEGRVDRGLAGSRRGLGQRRQGAVGLARRGRQGEDRPLPFHPAHEPGSGEDRTQRRAARSRSRRGGRAGRLVANAGERPSLAVRSTSRPRSMLAISPPSRHRPTPAIIEPEASAWEPAVAVSAEQFAMWRQQMQMMESFHNDMILMVQMFVAMHREHRVSVRDELDRVQKLTGELAVIARETGQDGGRPRRTAPRHISGRSKSRHTRSPGRNGAARAHDVKAPNDAQRTRTSPAQPPDPMRRSGAGNPISTSTDRTRKAVDLAATPAGHGVPFPPHPADHGAAARAAGLLAKRS